jgi:hypothetical protein
MEGVKFLKFLKWRDTLINAGFGGKGGGILGGRLH